jgi:hypothetical protein
MAKDFIEELMNALKAKGLDVEGVGDKQPCPEGKEPTEKVKVPPSPKMWLTWFNLVGDMAYLIAGTIGTTEADTDAMWHKITQALDKGKEEVSSAFLNEKNRPVEWKDIQKLMANSLEVLLKHAKEGL